MKNYIINSTSYSFHHCPCMKYDKYNQYILCHNRTKYECSLYNPTDKDFHDVRMAYYLALKLDTMITGSNETTALKMKFAMYNFGANNASLYYSYNSYLRMLKIIPVQLPHDTKRLILETSISKDLMHCSSNGFRPKSCRTGVRMATLTNCQLDELIDYIIIVRGYTSEWFDCM